MIKKYIKTLQFIFVLSLFVGLIACMPSNPELSSEKTREVLSIRTSTEEIETPVATSTSIPSPTATNTPTVTPSSTPTATPSPTATRERIQEPFFIPPGELGYNYFYTQENTLWGEDGLQPVSFVSADVEDISVDGEDVIVRIRTLVRNQEVVLVSKLKGFNYYDLDEEKNYYITPENVESFTDLIGKRVVPTFLYSQRQRTAKEKEMLFNTCNYTGDREGGIISKISYIPICSNWDLYASLDTEGVLNKDVYANYILGQEDLNNVDMNSISPLYDFYLYGHY